MDGSIPRSKARRASRVVLRALLALGLGLLLLELSLRFLLFSDAGWVRELAAPLRKASLYSSRVSGREHWRLRALFSGEKGFTPTPHFHPRLGWTKPGIDPATLRHADETKIGERRIVLLYGDSYAACTVPSEECWEGLLERSELGPRFCLLNYGVGGYGLDQMLLLLQDTLDLYAERDPIVVIGVLVEDDLDRTYLPLRNQPKPFFTLEDGALVPHPAEHRTSREYVREHPVGIKSYLWRAGLLGTGLVPADRAPGWQGEGDHVPVKKALVARILDEIRGELERRGLTGFFLVFHARESLGAPGLWWWQEPFLLEELGARGIPFVSSKRPLLEDARRTGTDLDDYYIDSGPGQNHYEPEANAIVFQALRAGLEGRFDSAADLATLAR